MSIRRTRRTFIQNRRGKTQGSILQKGHACLTVCVHSPCQEACITAPKLPASYYENLRRLYSTSRSLLLQALEEASFTCTSPEGAYYIWTDIGHTGFRDDRQLAKHL